MISVHAVAELNIKSVVGMKLNELLELNHTGPVGRNTFRSYFFVFFRLLPELSRQKALRKVEGRWMYGGHPFSADRIGKET